MNRCLTHTTTLVQTCINMMCHRHTHTHTHHLCGLVGLLIQPSLVLISLQLKCFPFYIL